MKVLVCGGRDYKDKKFIFKTLDRLHRLYGFDVVIEGDAPNTDRIAGYWARKNKLTNLKFPADWNKYGRAAGPIRNALMLRKGKPDWVIAFPGRNGTADMVAKAHAAGVEVLELKGVE